MGLNFKGKLIAFFAYAFFLLYLGMICPARANDCVCHDDEVRELAVDGEEINLKEEFQRDEEVREIIKETVEEEN